MKIVKFKFYISFNFQQNSLKLMHLSMANHKSSFSINSVVQRSEYSLKTISPSKINRLFALKDYQFQDGHHEQHKTRFQSSSEKIKHSHPGAQTLSQIPECGDRKTVQMPHPHICPNTPPPLGLNIDRCININIFTKFSIGNLFIFLLFI